MNRHLVFIASSKQDGWWKDRLVSHLQVHIQHGLLDVWDESCVAPGEDWRRKTREALDAASVIILLITADFLSSELFHIEILNRLDRLSNEHSRMVLPLLVRPCDWKVVDAIARMARYPHADRFISSGSTDDIDADFAAVASYVRGGITAGWCTGTRGTPPPPLEQRQPMDPTTPEATMTDDPRRLAHSATDNETGDLAYLSIVSESEHGSEHNSVPTYYPIRESARIGRDADNDVVLTGSGVSRAHARIVLNWNNWLLYDLHSTCGTYLNYRRVVDGVPLRDGDSIVVGPTLMKFFSGADARGRMGTEVFDDCIEGVSRTHSRRGLWSLIRTKCDELRSINALLMHVWNLSEILSRQGPVVVHSAMAEIARCMRGWLGPDVEVSRCGFDRFLALPFKMEIEAVAKLSQRVPARHIICVGDLGTVIKIRCHPMSLVLQDSSDGFWSQVDGWISE